jgi:predicted metal-dependent phosphoesterase TrpH
VERYRLSPDQAVNLLQKAGALVVLAHPTQLRLDAGALERFVKTLMQKGLGGIEAYSPYATDQDIADYCALAEKFRLAVTGGSDFHGASKPAHRLGYYRPGKKIPPHCLERVMHAVTLQDPQR